MWRMLIVVKAHFCCELFFCSKRKATYFAFRCQVICILYCYAGRLTPDDLFSSDFTDEELEKLFAHVSIPTLWVWSMKDEYVPQTVDKERHAERLEWAVKCDSEVVFVEV